MIIRRMTVKDVPQVYAIELATFPMPWSEQSFDDEMRRNACARYLVAQDGDGKIVAYGGVWVIFEEGHVTNVAVEASRRGQGIGRRLMTALMQYAANLGVQYLTLEVRRSNQTAQNLYKSLGFKELSVRKHYYENNQEDALLMVCDCMPPIEEGFTEPETEQSDSE